MAAIEWLYSIKLQPHCNKHAMNSDQQKQTVGIRTSIGILQICMFCEIALNNPEQTTQIKQDTCMLCEPPKPITSHQDTYEVEYLSLLPAG